MEPASPLPKAPKPGRVSIHRHWLTGGALHLQDYPLSDELPSPHPTGLNWELSPAPPRPPASLSSSTVAAPGTASVTSSWGQQAPPCLPSNLCGALGHPSKNIPGHITSPYSTPCKKPSHSPAPGQIPSILSVPPGPLVDTWGPTSPHPAPPHLLASFQLKSTRWSPVPALSPTPQYTGCPSQGRCRPPASSPGKPPRTPGKSHAEKPAPQDRACYFWLASAAWPPQREEASKDQRAEVT